MSRKTYIELFTQEGPFFKQVFFMPQNLPHSNHPIVIFHEPTILLRALAVLSVKTQDNRYALNPLYYRVGQYLGCRGGKNCIAPPCRNTYEKFIHIVRLHNLVHVYVELYIDVLSSMKHLFLHK